MTAAAAFPGVPAGLPAEQVPTDALGAVIVRGALLSESLADELLWSRESKPREGETDEQASVRAVIAKTLRTLARQVLGPDGLPLKTEAEWDIFGARYRADALALFNTANRLSGNAAGDAEKN